LDSAFVATCRDALEDLCGPHYDVRQYSVSETNNDADIYIWDAQCDSIIPAPMAAPGKAAKLILVSKPNLPQLRSTLPHNDFVFLNKPVTRSGLRTAFASTMSRLGNGRPTGIRQVSLDRDELLQQFLEANLALQEYERKRTNLLLRVVYDLCVPLMAAQGYSGLLLGGELGNMNVEQSRIIEKMQRSLTRLAGLASAIADVAGAGAAPLNPLNNEVQECGNQAVHECRPVAKQKQISVNVHFEQPQGPLYFDFDQLRHALVNLLDNSCKFTPKHGHIGMRGYSLGKGEMNEAGMDGGAGGYRIDVSDTGPGITPEQAETMFNECAAYGGSADRTGAGLNLAICRMIISAHRGRIWATPGGQSAKFSLVLPYIRSDAKPERANCKPERAK